MMMTANQFARLALAASIVALAAPALSQTNSPLVAKIVVPGEPLASFDIGWVDPTTQTYYLSDRCAAPLAWFL